MRSAWKIEGVAGAAGHSFVVLTSSQDQNTAAAVALAELVGLVPDGKREAHVAVHSIEHLGPVRETLGLARASGLSAAS